MDEAAPLPPAPEPPGRREIVRSSRKEDILEVSLVLASQGLKHWMEFDGREYSLALEENHENLARHVVEEYRRENEGFTEPEVPAGRLELYLAPLFHLAVPVAAYFWVGIQPWSNWLKDRGTADAELILQGETWRCLTATTLHADHEHFLGNVLSGFFILNLLNNRLGMGSIMALSTLGAALTNFLVAATAPHHRSIGFSSVVFCALGMLGAVESSFLVKAREFTLRRLAPLIAAFFIAVMVGLGENADVKAHFYGFGIGAVLGFLGRVLPKAVTRPPVQFGLMAAVYGAYVLAWTLAMRG